MSKEGGGWRIYTLMRREGVSEGKRRTLRWEIFQKFE